MDDTERAEQFAHFLAAMPRDVEPALAQGNVATAYLTALAKGWEPDRLIAEALRLLNGGGRPGLVVDHLKGLAHIKPQPRPQGTTTLTVAGPLPECSTPGCGQPFKRGFEPDVCPACGEDLRLRIGPDRTTGNHPGAATFLGTIKDLAVPADLAGALMESHLTEAKHDAGGDAGVPG